MLRVIGVAGDRAVGLEASEDVRQGMAEAVVEASLDASCVLSGLIVMTCETIGVLASSDAEIATIGGAQRKEEPREEGKVHGKRTR